MNIADTITKLIEIEGGYSNDKNDSGGETRYGITVAVARAFGYAGAMATMPQSIARSIYAERYWHQPRFSDVAQHSAEIAEELLDTGVNMGTGIAGRFLQRALNTLNQEGRTFPDMVVDGNIGSMTLAALSAYLKARGKPGEVVLLRMLNGQQSVRYMEIAEARASQESFMFGWQSNRVG